MVSEVKRGVYLVGDGSTRRRTFTKCALLLMAMTNRTERMS